MSLSFFFILFTYLVVAAACIRANNSFSGGLINTITLGIVLFAGIMSWIYGRRSPFWLGFFVFFTGLQLLSLPHSKFVFIWYTLPNAMGAFIHAKISSSPLVLEPIFEVQMWYAHVSSCFVATAFGIIGGLLTTKALGKHPDRAQLARPANNALEL